MKRKVNRVGTNTLTVSLPSRWTQQHNVVVGDELDVDLLDKAITFSKSTKTPARKEITINIDNFTYLALSRYFSVLYKTNYSKITLIYSTPRIYQPKYDEYLNFNKTLKRILSMMIGAEVVSQSSTKTEIECFLTEEKPDLDKIERRIFYLFKETTDELLNAIGANYKQFHETRYDHHNNITKFIHYFLRTLYNSERSSDEKKLAFAFYSRIDGTVDKLRHLSEKIDQYGCSQKVKKYLRDIFNLFYKEFEHMNKRKLSQEMIAARYALKGNIYGETFTVKELRVLCEIMPLLDTFNEFTEYILTKNLSIK